MGAMSKNWGHALKLLSFIFHEGHIYLSTNIPIGNKTDCPTSNIKSAHAHIIPTHMLHEHTSI